MTVKERLIAQISDIDNQDFMSALSSMIEYVDKEGTFQLPKNIAQEIKDRSKDIENGKFLSNENVLKKFN